ncbi:MAG: S8 family peptidase, partial [Acidobacteriota bacterium]|nr:S8 family peptidase [Acidobacteriota bacterium]
MLNQDQTPGAAKRIIIRVKPGEEWTVYQSLLKQGDTVTHYFPRMHAFGVIVQNNGDLSKLDQDADVTTASTDAVVKANAPPRAAPVPPPVLPANTLREQVGVQAYTPDSGLIGRGIGVALIDSGLAPSADVDPSRVTAFYDFTQGGILTTPSDGFGHGTHVAGLIGGTGALSGGLYAGVAPGVHFVVAKVLDDNGQGNVSDVIEALQFITENKDALDVQVVNMSLGHPPYEDAASDPLDQAVEQAVQAGLIVVASAGNYGTNPDTGQIGYAGIAVPGNAPDALTVGAVMTQGTATRDDDRVAPYSSRGPTWYDGLAKPDVVAPGDLLVSDMSHGSYLDGELNALLHPGRGKIPRNLLVGTDYMELSGTSMSAGVTTGVVALMLQAHQQVEPNAPPLTPNIVKAILQFTASSLNDDTGTPYDVLTQG